MFLNARFLILLLQVANSARVLESYKCWSSAGMGVHCDNYQEKKSLKLEHGRVEKGSLSRFVKDSDKDCFSEWFSLKKLVIWQVAHQLAWPLEGFFQALHFYASTHLTPPAREIYFCVSCNLESMTCPNHWFTSKPKTMMQIPMASVFI